MCYFYLNGYSLGDENITFITFCPRSSVEERFPPKE